MVAQLSNCARFLWYFGKECDFFFFAYELFEAKLKSFGLFSSAEEILRQLNIDSVAQVINNDSMKSYNEKE